VFSYRLKLLFSGFLHFKDNFVLGQNNSKCRDQAPLTQMLRTAQVESHYRTCLHNKANKIQSLLVPCIVCAGYCQHWQEEKSSPVA